MIGVQINYKLNIPKKSSWKAYDYQKFFRGIYGYTQFVSKSNGNHYSYPRKGIVEGSPFLKNGKNSLIIPKNHLQKFIDFFDKQNKLFSKSKLNYDVVFSTKEIVLNEQQLSEIKATGGIWN